MATAAYKGKSTKQAPSRGGMNVKNLVVAGACVALIAAIGIWLAYFYGIIGGEKPSTDPAIVDPASTLQPEEKKALEKFQKEQKERMESPEAPPPSGA